ncbi:tyrosine-type recombinase/integrase, partial [bacterium]|nr:tyrosine-type recombinase/integrase [bacterium]
INRLGEFISTLKDAPDSDPLTKAALQLLILTWCRTSEVIGAKWSEIEGDVWRIPAERMKARESHTIYLSMQAVELLR